MPIITEQNYEVVIWSEGDRYKVIINRIISAESKEIVAIRQISKTRQAITNLIYQKLFYDMDLANSLIYKICESLKLN